MRVLLYRVKIVPKKFIRSQKRHFAFYPVFVGVLAHIPLFSGYSEFIREYELDRSKVLPGVLPCYLVVLAPTETAGILQLDHRARLDRWVSTTTQGHCHR